MKKKAQPGYPHVVGDRWHVTVREESTGKTLTVLDDVPIGYRPRLRPGLTVLVAFRSQVAIQRLEKVTEYWPIYQHGPAQEIGLEDYAQLPVLRPKGAS